MLVILNRGWTARMHFFLSLSPAENKEISARTGGLNICAWGGTGKMQIQSSVAAACVAAGQNLSVPFSLTLLAHSQSLQTSRDTLDRRRSPPWDLSPSNTGWITACEYQTAREGAKRQINTYFMEFYSVWYHVGDGRRRFEVALHSLIKGIMHGLGFLGLTSE